MGFSRPRWLEWDAVARWLEWDAVARWLEWDSVDHGG